MCVHGTAVKNTGTTSPEDQLRWGKDHQKAMTKTTSGSEFYTDDRYEGGVSNPMVWQWFQHNKYLKV
jgi:hypothetical protein